MGKTVVSDEEGAFYKPEKFLEILHSTSNSRSWVAWDFNVLLTICFVADEIEVEEDEREEPIEGDAVDDRGMDDDDEDEEDGTVFYKLGFPVLDFQFSEFVCELYIYFWIVP